MRLNLSSWTRFFYASGKWMGNFALEPIGKGSKRLKTIQTTRESLLNFQTRLLNVQQVRSYN